jgi:hypothetical protein
MHPAVTHVLMVRSLCARSSGNRADSPVPAHAVVQGQIEDAQAEASQAKSAAEVEKLRAQTAVDQARREALALRKALDEAISRLQFTHSDTVDRRLIANLFVSFFSQGRPRDVLDIIARTLNFTDEERVIVGLRRLSIDGGGPGILGGLLSTVTTIASPGREFTPREDPAKSTLSDLWYEYLMAETDVDDAARVPRDDNGEGCPGAGEGGGMPTLSPKGKP